MSLIKQRPSLYRLFITNETESKRVNQFPLDLNFLATLINNCFC